MWCTYVVGCPPPRGRAEEVFSMHRGRAQVSERQLARYAADARLGAHALAGILGLLSPPRVPPLLDHREPLRLRSRRRKHSERNCQRCGLGCRAERTSCSALSWGSAGGSGCGCASGWVGGGCGSCRGVCSCRGAAIRPAKLRTVRRRTSFSPLRTWNAACGFPASNSSKESKAKCWRERVATRTRSYL